MRPLRTNFGVNQLSKTGRRGYNRWMTSEILKTVSIHLADEHATLGLGESLAQAAHPPLLVFLQGDLGAGKTTFSRGFMRGLGHVGSVKSPTYTIVEPYALEAFPVYHFDLYRLGDSEELEYLGLRDYLTESAVLLVEWPERGADRFPPPDLTVTLLPEDEGRHAQLTAHTSAGLSLIAHSRL